ncbi:MAG: 2-oxoglutarate oxidoreductase [Prevotellaceae bacterium]|jgi:2-oxoglutarate ferredoxin oxidoreductase subunit beta|nr:2-oxoglutarate oxidoreductase [Prevotellaceae bacterium]
MENVIEIARPENKVYARSKLLTDKVMHYCPGCSHGTIHKIVAEVIDEMNIGERTIGISPVGCAVMAYDYIDIDWQQAAHGRAPALATATKRLYPDKYVFVYQGDGDLASIGMGEIMHTCNRGENITVIFVNNAIYGMTGGQMAPTTLEGMKTSTSPEGRSAPETGFPMRVTEIVALFPGVIYAARHSVDTPAAVRKTKRAIAKAFKSQELKRGTSFIEIVSTCSSGWKMTPVEANKWMREHMFPVFPPGEIKLMIND